MITSNVPVVEKEDIIQKSIRGSKWVTVGIFIQKIFGILSFLTIARLLDPSHYGVMAVVGIIINLLDIFLSPSFGQALIQKKEVDPKILNQVWSLSVYRGIILSIIIFLVAPYIQQFFNIPGLTDVLRFATSFILIQGFGNVGLTYIFRDLAFEKILLRDVVGMFIQFIVTLTWALISPSVWALAVGSFAMYLSTCIITFFISDYRPKFVFSFSQIKKLIGYSKWVIGQNVINYFSSIVDTLLIARVLDATKVGLYTKSKDIAIIPSSYLYQITYKVGLSAYAKIQNSMDIVRDSFIKTLDFALIISLIFTLVILGYGYEYIEVFLGAKWVSIFDILKLLSIGMIFRSVYFTSFPVFDGIGKPKLKFLSLMVQLLSALICIYIFRYEGVQGIAIAIVISMFITSLSSLFMMVVFIKIPILKILRSLVVSATPFVCVAILIYFQKIYLPFGLFTSLIAGVLVPIIYFAILVVVGKAFAYTPHEFVLKTVKNFFKL